MLRSPKSNVVVLAAGLFLASSCEQERPAPLDFGDVEPLDLRATAIVPTLDAPVEQGKSVVWCATFQLAWDRLARDVLREPPIVRGAEALSKRLNDAADPEADLPEGTFYAAAGWMRDGIAGRIRKDMAAKFPAARPPDIRVTPLAVAVAYAYLQAGVKFKILFFENGEPLRFKNSTGTETKVSSFGVRREDRHQHDALRAQVAILHETGERGPSPVEFIIDQCKDSKPVQLILARIPWQRTLERTIAAAEEKIAGPRPSSRRPGSLLGSSVFLVPNFQFKLQHHFKDLEGAERKFVNKEFEGYWIEGAHQTILFRLDQSGANLTSEAGIVAASAATDYVFDCPFLLYLKKRAGGRPFFALWIDDPELLVPWP